MGHHDLDRPVDHACRQAQRIGMVSWFGKEFSGHLKGLPGIVIFILVAAIYFYIHYFFASATAHISALFPLSLALLIEAASRRFRRRSASAP